MQRAGNFSPTWSGNGHAGNSRNLGTFLSACGGFRALADHAAVVGAPVADVLPAGRLAAAVAATPILTSRGKPGMRLMI